MSEICPNVILPPEVTDEGWLFSEWENVELMLRRSYRDAGAFIQQAEAIHGESDERVAAISHGGFVATMVGAFSTCRPMTIPTDSLTAMERLLKSEKPEKVYSCVSAQNLPSPQRDAYVVTLHRNDLAD